MLAEVENGQIDVPHLWSASVQKSEWQRREVLLLLRTHTGSTLISFLGKKDVKCKLEKGSIITNFKNCFLEKNSFDNFLSSLNFCLLDQSEILSIV